MSEVATVPELVEEPHTSGSATCSRTATAPGHGEFEQVGWVLAGMDRNQPGPEVRDATVTDTDALLGEAGLLGGRDRRDCAKKEWPRERTQQPCRPRSRR